jgi:TolA-binding protein
VIKMRLPLIVGSLGVLPAASGLAAIETLPTTKMDLPPMTAASTITPSSLREPFIQLSQTSIDEENLTENELRQRVQELELRQQELEEEIDSLRQLIEQQAVEEEPTVPEQEVAEEPAIEDLQGLEFSAEAVFLQPRTSSLQDYAILDPGNALFVGGELVAPNYQQNTAGRFQLAYYLPNSPLSFSATHTTFDSSGNSSVTRPVNGFLLATLASPVQNESADTASSTINLNYDVTDVEVVYDLPSAGSLDTQLFGGLRIANIGQRNDVTYNGVDFTNGAVNIERYFSGYGLRLGGQANLNLGSNVSIFGRAAGSVLVSDITTNQQETDNNGADLIVSLNRTATGRVVPVMELAAGLQWQPLVAENLNLDFAAGYEFQNWFNVADTTRFVDNSGTGVVTQDSNDLSFTGFFIRLGILFRFE